MYSSKRFDKLAMTRSAYGLRGRGAFEVEQQRPDDVDEEEPFERWADRRHIKQRRADPLFYNTFLKDFGGKLVVNNDSLRDWLASSSRLPEHVRNHFFANLQVIQREAGSPFNRKSQKRTIKKQQSIVSQNSYQSRTLLKPSSTIRSVSPFEVPGTLPLRTEEDDLSPAILEKKNSSSHATTLSHSPSKLTKKDTFASRVEEPLAAAAAAAPPRRKETSMPSYKGGSYKNKFKMRQAQIQQSPSIVAMARLEHRCFESPDVANKKKHLMHHSLISNKQRFLWSRHKDSSPTPTRPYTTNKDVVKTIKDLALRDKYEYHSEQYLYSRMKEYDQERYEVPDVRQSQSELLKLDTTFDASSSPNLTRYLSITEVEDDEFRELQEIIGGLGAGVSRREGRAGGVFKDTQFWVHKGCILMNKEELRRAVNCFKQGLRLSPADLSCLFNLGCCFEKLKHYRKAKLMFERILEIRPNWPEVHYALCLAAYRLRDFALAQKHISQAIRQTTNSQTQCHLMYMRALCNKKVKDYQGASTSYRALMFEIRKIKKDSPLQSVLAMFTIFDRPQSQRTALLNKVQCHLDQEAKKQRPCLPSLYDFYVQGDGWDSDRVQQAVARLYLYNFFKRFSKQQLRHFLRNIALQTFQPQDIIFVEEPVVYVVLNGLAHLRTHEQDLINPTCIAELENGSIVGSCEDGGVSLRAQNQIVAVSKVETAVISRPFFEVMWQEQKKTNSYLLTTFLQEKSAIRGLSPMTMYLLGYELLQIVRYRVGEVICPQSKKSELNFKYHAFLATTFSDLKKPPPKPLFHAAKLQHSSKKRVPATEKLKNLVALASRRQDPWKRNPAAAEVEMQLGKTAKNMEKFAHSILEDVRNRDTEGLFIIESGNAVVRNAHDNHQVYFMKPGDVFGEHSLFEIQGLDLFGDLVAESECTVFFLQKQLLERIPIYEISKLKGLLSDRGFISKMLQNQQKRYRLMRDDKRPL